MSSTCEVQNANQLEGFTGLKYSYKYSFDYIKGRVDFTENRWA